MKAGNFHYHSCAALSYIAYSHVRTTDNAVGQMTCLMKLLNAHAENIAISLHSFYGIPCKVLNWNDSMNYYRNGRFDTASNMENNRAITIILLWKLQDDENLVAIFVAIFFPDVNDW